MIRSRLLPVVVTLVVAGCSAGTTGPGTATGSPSAGASGAGTPSTPPADARTLRQFDLAHGPVEFTLPAATVIDTRIDQPNVVTLTFDVAARRTLSGWFGKNLPTGWAVDAEGNDSVLFSGPEWQGAFTCSTQSCALTLRRQG